VKLSIYFVPQHIVYKTIFVFNALDKTKKSHLMIAVVIAILRNRNLQARRYAAHTFIGRICKDATCSTFRSCSAMRMMVDLPEVT